MSVMQMEPDALALAQSEGGQVYLPYDSIEILCMEDILSTTFYFGKQIVAHQTEHVSFVSGSTLHLQGLKGRVGITITD